MTTIRLDDATLDKFKAANGPVVLCDESGKPVLFCELLPGSGPDPEPHHTEAEWKAIMDSPVKHTTEQVVERLRSPRGS